MTQAERNVIYGIRSYGFYQKTFAVDTVTTYFNLLTQKDIVRNNYRSFTNKLETTRYLEARAVDRERRSQVDDARNSELSAQRDYVNSVASYLTLMDSFKLRLGIPISTKLYLDDSDLKQLLQAGLLPVDIDKNAAFAICLEQQPEVLTAIDRFEDSKRKVRVAADQLRADVGLFGSATLTDSSNDYLNFDPNKVRYTAGLRINLPIDRLRERNSYRATLISFESQLRSLGLTLDTYKDRIDRGLRTIEQARLNFLNGEESLKVATRRVENNSMLLEAGRATVRDLREAQDQLIAAENNLATLYTAYLSARLNLMLNIGVIDTSLARFWLTDPLKDKLKPEQIRPPELRMPEDRVLPPETFLEPAA